jgi:hypothetical protein
VSKNRTERLVLDHLHEISTNAVVARFSGWFSCADEHTCVLIETPCARGQVN